MKAILLAAGQSRRFGGNKLLENFHGRPLYEYAVSLVKGLSWEEIIFVTQYEEILNQLDGSGLTLIKNDNPLEGIASSIRLGMRTAGSRADVMFFVCDQPYLKRETVLGMQEDFFKRPEGIVCARSQNRTGNPNIFAASFYHELVGLRGDRGGKRIIKAHPEQVRYYMVEEKELKDLDYREDFYE